MQIDGSFEGSDQRISAMLQKKGPAAVAEVVNGVNVQAFKLQSHIVVDKLNGQVLHHRSGKLAGSIHVIPATVAGGSISADVLGAGGPAWYGRIHEYGGAKAYVIEATKRKSLMFRIGDRVVFAKRVNHPPAVERSFMRSALDDLRATIATWLRETLGRVFSK
jgi:hypothetical protein